MCSGHISRNNAVLLVVIGFVFTTRRPATCVCYARSHIKLSVPNIKRPRSARGKPSRLSESYVFEIFAAFCWAEDGQPQERSFKKWSICAGGAPGLGLPRCVAVRSA